ncbi:hypothetical protein VSR01_12115 [Actinacidiphila sp. DG2A-62]|uniref:hypothetical protein n=1 Tax=Actinacidiphila sp. DG2A-62 TaxID=3108821 RepID=UPI002DB93425|nr:hypothetical protein [Actinacidiphila sp. DG2A-62]MEC3994246.1 hypothetical protein [Actinacidiphila sp. DG2A-62]
MTTHSDGGDGGAGGGRDGLDPWHGGEIGGGDGGISGEDGGDVLAVLLRPTGDFFPAPPGRYAAIRRGAARRRLLRAAAGAAVTCAVAVLVALPLRHAVAGRGGDRPLVPPAAPASRAEPPARQDPTPYPRPTATPRPGSHGTGPADSSRGPDRPTGGPTAQAPSAVRRSASPTPTADPVRRVVPRSDVSRSPTTAPTTDPTTDPTRAPGADPSTAPSTAPSTGRPTDPVRASPAQTALRSG